MKAALEMRFPVADVKIKIALSTINFRSSRLRFRSGGRFRFLTLKSHHPIRFPSLASIIRERLFKPTRIRRDGGKTISGENDSPIELFLIEKFATTILESADHRLVEHAVAAIRPIQTPLVRVGIV